MNASHDNWAIHFKRKCFVTLLHTHREVTWQEATSQPPPEQAGMRAPHAKGFFFFFYTFPSQWAVDDAEILSFGLRLAQLRDTMPQSTELTWSVRLRAWPSVGHCLISFIPNHHSDRGAMNSAVVEWKDYLRQCRDSAIRESKVFWDGSFSLCRCSSCHRDGETFLTFFHCRSDSAKKKKNNV